MKRLALKFHKCESGAVSADWVAITAAIVLFAVAISTSIKTSTVTAGNTISGDLTAQVTP